MTIHKATTDDLPEWRKLALELWPAEDDTDVDDMQSVLTNILQSPTQDGFLVRDEPGTAIGFMNLSLRTDYVPGATRYPVAFVEGIYVQPAYQQQGIGNALIRQAEAWAREHGCAELASDALVANAASEAFHKRVGFEEVGRVIQFIKTL